MMKIYKLSSLLFKTDVIEMICLTTLAKSILFILGHTLFNILTGHATINSYLGLDIHEHLVYNVSAKAVT
jgi:hypothetical protein